MTPHQDPLIPTTTWRPEPRPIVRDDYRAAAIVKWRRERDRLLGETLSAATYMAEHFKQGNIFLARKYAQSFDQWRDLYVQVTQQRPQEPTAKQVAR